MAKKTTIHDADCLADVMLRSFRKTDTSATRLIIMTLHMQECPYAKDTGTRTEGAGDA